MEWVNATKVSWWNSVGKIEWNIVFAPMRVISYITVMRAYWKSKTIFFKIISVDILWRCFLDLTFEACFVNKHMINFTLLRILSASHKI